MTENTTVNTTVNVTFFDVLGKRIVSVETPNGFVHVCDGQAFEHVSDAVRYVKGLAARPVEQVSVEPQDVKE